MLQYYDVLLRKFEDYTVFAVSENESCEVDLPEVSQNYNSQVRAAAVWRVLILNPNETDDVDESREEDADNNENEK